MVSKTAGHKNRRNRGQCPTAGQGNPTVRSTQQKWSAQGAKVNRTHSLFSDAKFMRLSWSTKNIEKNWKDIKSFSSRHQSEIVISWWHDIAVCRAKELHLHFNPIEIGKGAKGIHPSCFRYFLAFGLFIWPPSSDQQGRDNGTMGRCLRSFDHYLAPPGPVELPRRLFLHQAPQNKHQTPGFRVAVCLSILKICYSYFATEVVTKYPLHCAARAGVFWANLHTGSFYIYFGPSRTSVGSFPDFNSTWLR